MTDHTADRAFDKLVLRAIVPKGLRPRTNGQVAGMLDTIGGVPVDAEKLQRMLRKINRAEPVGPAPKKSLPFTIPGLTESDQQLIALHRSQGKAIPPAIQERLRELERRAAENGDGASGD